MQFDCLSNSHTFVKGSWIPINKSNIKIPWLGSTDTYFNRILLSEKIRYIKLSLDEYSISGI